MSGDNDNTVEIELTPHERVIIRQLKRIAKRWPPSLVLFAGNGTLTVRKPPAGQFYGSNTVVADVPGIRCDGGDGGDE